MCVCVTDENSLMLKTTLYGQQISNVNKVKSFQSQFNRHHGGWEHFPSTGQSSLLSAVIVKAYSITPLGCRFKRSVNVIRFELYEIKGLLLLIIFPISACLLASVYRSAPGLAAHSITMSPSDRYYDFTLVFCG